VTQRHTANPVETKARLNEQGLIALVGCSSIGIQKNHAAYISQPKEVITFAAFGSFIVGTGSVETPLP
jgi:hypothetical protein